jgi:hypothetical protein
LLFVWLACVWVVWNERNRRIFNDSEASVYQLLDKVKMSSYRWLIATNVSLALTFIVGGRVSCSVWEPTDYCLILLFWIFL